MTKSHSTCLQVLAAFFLAGMIINGCSSSDSPVDKGESKAADTVSPASSDTKSAGNKTAADAVLAQTRKMYPGIELRAWPGLTLDSIGQLLTGERVTKELNIESELKITKAEYSPDWKFEWRDTDNKKRSFTVGLLLENMPEHHLIMQAGVRKGMSDAEGKKSDEVDLSKYGVMGFWSYMKGESHLQVCCKHKLLHISTRMVFGRNSTDTDAKKQAATQIANVLFENLGE